MSRLPNILAALALFTCTGAAMAQYVWLNEKGVKQYSDVPPPASVPSSRILKSPGGAPQTDKGPETSDASGADSESAKKPAVKTLAEQNAEFEKRRAEQAEKDKQAAEKAKQAAAKQRNCELARNYNRALSSGQRVSRLNAAGERVYLSDEERAQEERDAQRTLANCN